MRSHNLQLLNLKSSFSEYTIRSGGALWFASQIKITLIQSWLRIDFLWNNELYQVYGILYWRTIMSAVLIVLSLTREERIPTRCNNIDDLLSIPDVDY